MKVLHVNTSRTWGGGERQTLILLKTLRSKGVEVEALVRTGSLLSKKLRDCGIKTHEVANRWLALVWLVRNGRNYDVVHAHTGGDHEVSVLSKTFFKRPVVCTRRILRTRTNPINRCKFERTDKVVAVSRAVGERLRERLGVEEVEVIPDCFDPDCCLVDEVRALKKRFEGKFILATSSALQEVKDPFTLLRAVEDLSRIRSDFVFLHFGEGPLYGRMEGLIRRRGLEEVYRLMGFKEDVHRIFPAFDVFVMTSREEGLGSSVLDAFIYRVPVVATRACGLEELVRGRGLLCGVGDHRCVAQSINKLLEDPVLRGKLVDRAFNDAVRLYNPERTAELYLSLYTLLIRSNR
jgi:glycosyltransferase involved in cell wall biosynthesis